jgi:dihydrolipoamide dehydrogenase
MPVCLFGQDSQVISVVEDSLRKEGVDIFCNASITGIGDSQQGKRISFSTTGEEQSLETACIAVCVGYRPNTEGLGLEECGIQTDNGAIKVNSRIKTSVPDIYAAGDVTGGIMLAHMGYEEGKVAAQNALGVLSHVNTDTVLRCIFTSPEAASVGLTEEEAASRGYNPVTGSFPFAANGMAQILGDTRGLVKIIADEKYRQILGVHIVGPNATGLIHEAALAIRLESTAFDLQQTIHAHPTPSEALWEASLDLTGEALHS